MDMNYFSFFFEFFLEMAQSALLCTL